MEKQTAIVKKMDEAIEADLSFQDRLEGFDKVTLAMGLHSFSSTREWILNYLEGMEDLLISSGVIETPKSPKGDFSQMDSIFDAIRVERRRQDERYGPVEMNPHTMNEWCERIERLLGQAKVKASFGMDRQALDQILLLARETVACLEERIGALTGGDSPIYADNGQPFDEDAIFTPKRAVTANGISYRGHWYWDSWMANWQGRAVILRFPSESGALLVADAQTKAHIGVAYRTEKKDETPKSPKGDFDKKTGDVDTSPADGQSTNS